MFRALADPTRLAILELRVARHWSAAQTARSFLVESDTVAAWTKRIDDARQGRNRGGKVPGLRQLRGDLPEAGYCYD